MVSRLVLVLALALSILARCCAFARLLSLVSGAVLRFSRPCRVLPWLCFACNVVVLVLALFRLLWWWWWCWGFVVFGVVVVLLLFVGVRSTVSWCWYCCFYCVLLYSFLLSLFCSSPATVVTFVLAGPSPSSPYYYAPFFFCLGRLRTVERVERSFDVSTSTSCTKAAEYPTIVCHVLHSLNIHPPAFWRLILTVYILLIVEQS